MRLEGAEVRNIYGISTKINEPDHELRIRIPYYQRPYKWSNKQIENLFSDFFQNYNESEDKEYFIGSVVLVKSDKDELFDVVDGQQRTTTVFLLNYILVLLQRCYIEDLFMVRKTNNISQAVDDLIKSLKMLLIMDPADMEMWDDYSRNISDKLDELNEKKGQEKEDMADSLLKDFRLNIGLPQNKVFDDLECYCLSVYSDMADFLANRRLTLNYKRDAYNSMLKKALSSISVVYSISNSPEIVVSRDVNEESPLFVYTNAIETEFNCIKNRIDKSLAPIDKIKKMIEIINSMLDNLSFCKVLTGDENDAYTLFEVLNDRALEVEDLELVKNMFFRKYCTSTADNESKKDKTIERLDDLWGDSIFNGCSKAKVQLIAYCASVYLTGNSDLVMNKGQRFRDELEKYYLSKFKAYEYDDINYAFQVFQAIRIILDRFKLQYKTTYKYSLIAENDINKSNIYKTMNLIHAMDYDAVLASLTNVIISEYCNKHSWGFDSMENFSNYIDGLVVGSNKDEYRMSYECGELLRTAVLLSKNYDIPRKIAREIIKKNCFKQCDGTIISLSSKDKDELTDEYRDWTRDWRYGSDKQNYKLKVLFINLYQTEKKGDKLYFPKAKKCFSDNIEVALDHLDASSIDESAEEKYFKPKDTNDDRENYVDSIGNMMILDGKNNLDKNNKPLYKALEYHKKLSSHWLVDEIEYMIKDDNYSEEKTSGTEKFRVVNEKYFTERSKRLQSYFYAMINKQEGKDEVNISAF